MSPSEDRVPILEAISGPVAGRRFALGDGDRAVIGRASGATVQLGDDAVSRRHARVYRARGRFFVSDLGSRNGTLVNGRRVAHHCLSAGDRLTIGASLFRVELLSADAAAAITATPTMSRERPASEGSGRSMTGTLSDIPLADVLQWLATSRKTGTLRVKGRNTGDLYLRGGQICGAIIPGSPALRPERALQRMLQWSDGTFALDSAIPEGVGTQALVPLEGALMEAARLTDELSYLASRETLPGERLITVIPAPKRWRELTPDQLDLLQATVEGLSWRETLDRIDADEVVASKAAVALRSAGFVRFG